MKSVEENMIDAATSDRVSPLTWLAYGVMFALLWTLLTQGDLSAWIIGAGVVPLATWCAIRLFPVRIASGNGTSPVLSFTALLRFIPFFLTQSLKGGWESALLAIHPRQRVHSGFIRYSIQLPPGRSRLFFINTVSLLPGTVSAKCQGDEFTIHALDTRADNHTALQQCEAQIAGLFGLSLDGTAPSAKEVGARP